ncbi:hypothetical protein V6N13_033943 [Hibiscus sabdariffa]
MIGVFEAAADKPSNPRKHRRFDKEPPDRGGPGNRPTQMDVVVDADGIMVPPSYKDSLLHGNGAIPSGEEFDEDDDIDILIHAPIRMLLSNMSQQPTDQDVSVDAESVAIVTSKTAVDKSLYGPWMVVEPLPRRVPRKQAENNVRQHDIVFVQPSLVTTTTNAPLVFRARQKVKGKSVVISKPSSGTHVRNPLTLSDFPILSRNFHKGGSSKSVPPQVVSLDASKHYVVVINENSDLNVQQPMQQASDPPHMQHHLLGEPPDLN